MSETTTSPDRTHVGVELRLTAGEADALDAAMAKLVRMVRRGVMPWPADSRDDLFTGTAKLSERLSDRSEPWDA